MKIAVVGAAVMGKLDFEQMKATPITVPDKERRTCPPMP